MKTYGGVVTSALDGYEWSASRSCRFTPGETALVGGWVGLRAGLDVTEKRKNVFVSTGNRIPTVSSISQSAHYTD
jgi:hypothetical protein